MVGELKKERQPRQRAFKRAFRWEVGSEASTLERRLKSFLIPPQVPLLCCSCMPAFPN